MKKSFDLAILFLLFLHSTAVYAGENMWDRTPNLNGAYGYDDSLPDLLNIKGLSYHKARLVIIEAGWEPLQTLYEDTEDYKQSVTSGNGPDFWNKGCHELKPCAMR